MRCSEPGHRAPVAIQRLVGRVAELGSFGNKMKRIVVVSLCVIVVGVLVLGWAMFGDRSSFQTGLDRYEGLPHTASDITIYENKNMSGVFIADFKIAERDFVSFAATQHWSLEPISGSASVFQAKAFHEGRSNDKKEISDGLYYSKRAGNGGGVTVAYDRKDGRGYIDSSSR